MSRSPFKFSPTVSLILIALYLGAYWYLDQNSKESDCPAIYDYKLVTWEGRSAEDITSFTVKRLYSTEEIGFKKYKKTFKHKIFFPIDGSMTFGKKEKVKAKDGETSSTVDETTTSHLAESELGLANTFFPGEGEVCLNAGGADFTELGYNAVIPSPEFRLTPRQNR